MFRGFSFPNLQTFFCSVLACSIIASPSLLCAQRQKQNPKAPTRKPRETSIGRSQLTAGETKYPSIRRRYDLAWPAVLVGMGFQMVEQGGLTELFSLVALSPQQVF
jgi:hypothetical protein